MYVTVILNEYCYYSSLVGLVQAWKSVLRLPQIGIMHKTYFKFREKLKIP